MRVKPVTREQQRRDEREPADEQQELDGVGAVGPFIAAPSGALERGPSRAHGAGARGASRAARRRRVDVASSSMRPSVARLVLAVGADRRDAVLGDADEHELAAGADEVQRAVGAERQRRRCVSRPVPWPRSSLERLDLLEDPVRGRR